MAVRLAAHTDACTGCRRFRTDAEALSRGFRIRIASAEPDRTAAILAALPAGRTQRDPVGILRYVIAAIAVVQLTAAVPLLHSHDHMGGHLERHVAVSAIAFTAGLFVVAWRPVRAPALLPVLAVLVVGLAWSCLGDIVAGRPVPAGALPHALDLAGLAAVMALHRFQRGPLPSRRGVLTR